MKILNAFSPTMVPKGGAVCFTDIDIEEARWLVSKEPIESAIGHPGTAEVFSRLLIHGIEPARTMVVLKEGETALLGSINARLPEGKVLTAEELKNLPIRWVKVTMMKDTECKCPSSEEPQDWDVIRGHANFPKATYFPE